MNPNDLIPQAILNHPASNEPLLGYAKRLLTSFTGNTLIPNLTVPLATFSADIAAYDKAQAAVGTGTKGTATTRNAKRKKVIDDMKHYRNDVQAAADAAASPVDAAAVIASVYMGIRKTAVRTKLPLSVKNGATSGTVVVIARAVARLATYYWQWSLDSKNWSTVPETMKARTVITGLTPGQVYYFRFHALTRTTAVDFSQAVNLLVH